MVSCPFANTGKGMLSVFRESDMHRLYVYVPTSTEYILGNNYEIISSGNLHRVIFNTKKASTIGALNMLEIYVNQRAPNSIKTNLIQQLHIQNDITEYAKHLSFDRSSNKLYITNAGTTTSTGMNRVEAIQICNQFQTYDSSSKLCRNLESNQITFGIQDTVSTS